MSEKPDQQYSKNDSVDLRIIFLGDIGVGKKSLINRFKFINASETKTIDFNGFYALQKRPKTSKTKVKKLPQIKNPKKISQHNQMKLWSKKPRRINYIKDAKKIELIV